LRIIKRKENLLIIGIFSLLIMIVLRIISIGLPILDFLEGMFAGISMVLNIYVLIRFGKEQRIKANKLRDYKERRWFDFKESIPNRFINKLLKFKCKKEV